MHVFVIKRRTSRAANLLASGWPMATDEVNPRVIVLTIEYNRRWPILSIKRTPSNSQLPGLKLSNRLALGSSSFNETNRFPGKDFRSLTDGLGYWACNWFFDAHRATYPNTLMHFPPSSSPPITLSAALVVPPPAGMYDRKPAVSLVDRHQAHARFVQVPYASRSTQAASCPEGCLSWPVALHVLSSRRI
jgi:hypothetical protein